MGTEQESTWQEERAAQIKGALDEARRFALRSGISYIVWGDKYGVYVNSADQGVLSDLGHLICTYDPKGTKIPAPIPEDVKRES